MFRGRICLVVVIALSTLLFLPGLSYAMPTDISGHWAEPQIATGVDRGWIEGYSDDTFRPDNYVSRAEFAALMNKAFGFESKQEINFSDVPQDAWFADHISKGAQAGYLKGYTDGTVRPNNYITRQEAAVVLSEILNLNTESPEDVLGIFKDVEQIADWSKGAVQAIASRDIIKGYPDGTFKPEGFITRAEVIAMLVKAAGHPIITGITVTNGTVQIKAIGNVSGLELKDFDVKVEFDGKPYQLSNLRFDSQKMEIRFGKVYTNDKKMLQITVSAAEHSSLFGSATSSVVIDERRSSGGGGGGGGGGDGGDDGGTEPANTAPTTPVISKNPAGNVSVDDLVTMTASSNDAEGDAITYIWTGRLDETSKYPAGRHVITVKAVDEHGLESQPAAIIFFSLDTTNGSGGMVLTGPESRIYENGIDGATITSYTFNVPQVSGHYGNDFGRVKGLNIITGEWDQLDYQTVSNGVYFSRSLPEGFYSRLEFYYYTNHDCMYNKSNITYTVEFSFGNIPPGTPAEEAPSAADPAIGGTPVVGETLNGSYTYSDANGDMEGTSTYQWYRADDAAGTNPTPIPGAVNNTYVTTTDDENKFIFFEVTPVALTGVAGTITGSPVQSQTVEIKAVAAPIPEAVPVVTNVSVSGNPDVGSTLTGNYTYNDANGDLEGASIFKWYRGDSPDGTGKEEIIGAVNNSYLLTPDDENKYIFFEVTPVATTGDQTGIPVVSGAAGPVVRPV